MKLQAKCSMFMPLWSMVPKILLHCITLNDPKDFPPLQCSLSVQFIYLINSMSNNQNTTSIFYYIFYLQLQHQFINVYIFSIQNHVVKHVTTHYHIWKKMHIKIRLGHQFTKCFLQDSKVIFNNNFSIIELLVEYCLQNRVLKSCLVMKNARGSPCLQ